jgi:hypothetical protein
MPKQITYQTTLVAQSAVGSDKDVIGNSLSEDLDLQDIGNDLLSLTVDIGVNQCNVVVAGNNIAQSRKSLLNALDGNRVRERVSQVLKFLICGCGGDQESVAVTDAETANNAGTGNTGVDDGDDILQLGLEDTIVFGKQRQLANC